MTAFRIENPNYRPIIIPDTGTSSAGGAVNAGVAAFATGGVGEGFDFVTIVFLTPMANVNYAISLSAGVPDATLTSPPNVFWDDLNKTVNGFRIFPQAQFAGKVTWSVVNKTQ